MERNEVFLLRHAQTVGNKTGDYDRDDHTTLSEQGKRQAEEIATPLGDLDINAIAISPLERVRETILPYLRATDRTAEVWPELAEGCWHTDHDDRRIEEIRPGEKITLAGDEQPLLSLEPDEYPAQRPPGDESYAEGLTRIRLAHERIERRLPDDSSAGYSLLVVAHGHLNPRLAELLLDMEPYGRMDHANTGLTRIWEPPEEKHDRRLAFCNRPLAETGVSQRPV